MNSELTKYTPDLVQPLIQVGWVTYPFCLRGLSLIFSVSDNTYTTLILGQAQSQHLRYMHSFIPPMS